MAMTCGWFSAEAARASCTNRDSRLASLTTSGGRIFSATDRASVVSRAR
jgi:hypothetical protein